MKRWDLTAIKKGNKEALLHRIYDKRRVDKNIGIYELRQLTEEL